MRFGPEKERFGHQKHVKPCGEHQTFMEAIKLTREQRDILYHTEHRAAGGLYCGGGKEMDALIAAGLMESAGRKSFVPDEYFCITSKGRSELRKTP